MLSTPRLSKKATNWQLNCLIWVVFFPALIGKFKDLATKQYMIGGGEQIKTLRGSLRNVNFTMLRIERLQKAF